MKKVALVSLLLICTAIYAEQYDFSKPENTLKGYYNCLYEKNLECLKAHTLDVKNFHFGTQSKMRSFEIKKVITYTEKEVSDWNSKGIIPPAKIGDVEYQVYQISGNHSGMWSYNFRKVDGKWLLLSWSGWDAP